MTSLLNSKRYSMFEVAKLLNVHVATIWRWYLHGVRGRKLPTVLIGARRFVLAADLDAFLAAGSQDPTGLPGRRERADQAAKLLDARRIGVHRRRA